MSVIIKCPGCQTRFNLKDNTNILGKEVKCYKCQTVWSAHAHIDPILELTPNIPQDDLPPAPIPEPKASVSKSKSHLVWMFLFGFAIAVLGGWLFVLKSTPVETGIKADLTLSLSPLEYKQTDEEKTLIIRGHITNKTDQLYRLPALNILLLDKNHNLLSKKTRLPPTRLLGPGREIGIEFKIRNPPQEIYKVEVNFEVSEDQ
ncbi:MAG: zinc-ribbon domain-containing protein [Alphaproteobacteria bacterium]|nr:zinc-ribbon domain-containing protein [Alphaproteobacteria bacterium]MBN2779712.1 zinc-ribbon domain-containing protein [Alphaproteobacteria bacterium]